MNDDETRGRELLEAARKLLEERFAEGRHHVAAVVRTGSGAIYRGVSLETNVGRAAICAEGVAIGAAAVAGDVELTRVVAVGRDGQVVSPCGICRELITDLAPEAAVLVPGEDGEADRWLPARRLLPSKYRRRWSRPGDRRRGPA